MDEFSLINTYFKSIEKKRKNVIVGIGDDAACLQVPQGMQLLVSTDTLIANVHFLSEWDPYDIAAKAVRVNVSDIAAMGGTPCWVLLALTLPECDDKWLERFSSGLHDSLKQYDLSLVGGDTTRGPLSMTLTIHGFVPKGSFILRNGAKPGDIIYVSGELGAAALAVKDLSCQKMKDSDKTIAMNKLLYPEPRVDFCSILQSFATAAIDVSDGLSADLSHICEESHVGASLFLEDIPVHGLVQQYLGKNALDFALNGGDDYELCFTVSPENEAHLLEGLKLAGLSGYRIGVIEEQLGLRGQMPSGKRVPIVARGYNHFTRSERD